jgi:hypothetical protein
MSTELTTYLETVNSLKNQIIDYIRLRLGDQIIDIEADKEHYEMAIKQALIKYRQRSSNSIEESYAFLDLVKETQEYILPQEVISVRQIFRRGIGSVTGTTASQFEPFAAGYLNTYMLVAGRVGGLANYELFTQYQELAMKMFGGYINFTFNHVTKKLTIVRKIPDNGESVMLWLHNYKPDQIILSDHMAFPWVQDYAYALVKYTIGEAREKFSQVAGPQGGTTLNGTTLKTEAKELLDKLEQDLINYVDGSMPYTFVIG